MSIYAVCVRQLQLVSVTVRLTLGHTLAQSLHCCRAKSLRSVVYLGNVLIGNKVVHRECTADSHDELTFKF